MASEEDEALEEFRRRLTAEMSRRGIDRARLAAMIGSKRSVIDHWFKDRGPSIGKIAEVAHALGVDVQLLWPAPLRPDVGERHAPSSELKEALDGFAWPNGTTTAIIAEISDALSREAFAHRGSYIPSAHFRRRIGEELSARKGKRIATESSPDVNTDEESPEVREHKSKRKRASGRG